MRAVYGCCCMLLAMAIYGCSFRLRFSDREAAGRACCPLPSFLTAARAGWLSAVAAVVQGWRCVAPAADHVGGWMPGPLPACAAACCLCCCPLWLMRSGPAAAALTGFSSAHCPLWSVFFVHTAQKTAVLCHCAPLWCLHAPCNPYIIRLCGRKLSSK